MRILHTSDWHLGHSLYDYDRLDEQSYMLDSLIDIAGDECPDAVVVSGDIFDSPQPSNAAYRMFVDKIDVLRQRCPGAVIIAVAGNHDSATRHELFRTPWRRDGIHLIGVTDIRHPENHLIDIHGKGAVLALPYINPSFAPDNYYAAAVAAARAAIGGELPLVLAAHLAVAPSPEAIGESIGNVECMDGASLGKDYDYAALGHIHRRYAANTGSCAYYCGTPLAVSFDEQEDHGVLIVDIERAGADPVVRTVPILTQRPLLTLPEKGYATMDECLQLLKSLPPAMEAYIRLNVSQPLPPGAEGAVMARKALENKRARLCVVNYHRPERQDGANGGDQRMMPLEEFISAQPVDIARLCARDKGFDFTDEVADMFAQAVATAGEEMRS